MATVRDLIGPIRRSNRSIPLKNLLMNHVPVSSRTASLCTTPNWTSPCKSLSSTNGITLPTTWSRQSDADLKDMSCFGRIWLHHFSERKDKQTIFGSVPVLKKLKTVHKILNVIWTHIWNFYFIFFNIPLRQSRRNPIFLRFQRLRIRKSQLLLWVQPYIHNKLYHVLWGGQLRVCKPSQSFENLDFGTCPVCFFLAPVGRLSVDAGWTLCNSLRIVQYSFCSFNQVHQFPWLLFDDLKQWLLTRCFCPRSVARISAPLFVETLVKHADNVSGVANMQPFGRQMAHFYTDSTLACLIYRWSPCQVWWLLIRCCHQCIQNWQQLLQRESFICNMVNEAFKAWGRQYNHDISKMTVACLCLFKFWRWSRFWYGVVLL